MSTTLPTGTTETAPRPMWIAALDGLVGVVVAFGWWHVLLADISLPATLALAGVAGVRMASGGLRTR